MDDEFRAFVSEVPPVVYAAEVAFRNGDADARLQLWSTARPVSWVGQFGTVVQGRAALEDHFRWVASRFGGVMAFKTEPVAQDAFGDTAYTVEIERFEGVFDGQAGVEMTHRVSRLYCLEDGRWRIAHGHGDIAPWVLGVTPDNPGGGS